MERLRSTSIIAAVNTGAALPVALASPAQLLYLLCGTPLSLPSTLEQVDRSGKLCFVNLDFIEGLARDRHAIEFLAHYGVNGIVSTRVDMLRIAHALGIVTVLRTFAIDSAAVNATLRSTAQFLPDAIEVLPAVAAPKVLVRFREREPNLHIIGGGLITTIREIERLLELGVNSVSVSDPRLWVI